MNGGFGRFSGAGVDPDRIGSLLILTSLISIPMIGTLAALGFLASGLALMALKPWHSILAAWSYVPVLVLPVFCTLTFLWSDAPALTLRFGLQLTFTMLIAIVLAERCSLQRFLIISFWVLAIVTVLSIVAGNYRSDTGALTGFYASKNAMGGAAAILALVAWGLARTGPPLHRVIAAGTAAIAILAIILAQSVSALMALIMALMATYTVQILRKFRPIARWAWGVFFILLSALALILGTAYFEAVSGVVLDLTGKDVTLTGRTDLWLIAAVEIANRPLTGVGYQAFWQHGNPTAELMWEQFGIASRSGFHFHNTYLSNAVEIGLPGMVLQTVLIFAVVIRATSLALRQARPDSDILFGLVAMIFVLTPVEVPIFFQFNLTTFIFVAAIVYTRRTAPSVATGSDPQGSPVAPTETPPAYPTAPPVRSATDAPAG